jgi:hypothetical protein
MRVMKKIMITLLIHTLNDVECSVLSNQERQLCDEFPTLHECDQAIRQLKNNKSHGSDGLPVEFYKIFWNEIKYYYYK